jgi:hypothetical protein
VTLPAPTPIGVQCHAPDPGSGVPLSREWVCQVSPCEDYVIIDIYIDNIARQCYSSAITLTRVHRFRNDINAQQEIMECP